MSRRIALALAAVVAACGGGSSSGPVGPSSVGDGSGGGGMGGGGSGGTGGGPGGGGGGSGGMGGGGGSGGMGGGGGSGGTGGGGGGGGGGGMGGGGGSGGGAACDPAGPITYEGFYIHTSDGGYEPRIATDSTHVYFVGVIGTPSATLGLYRIAKTGGAPERVGDFPTANDDSYLYDFAVDEQTIYLMAFGDATYGSYAGHVNVYDQHTGFARVIDASSGNDCSVPILRHLALFGGALYWDQSNTGKYQTPCTLNPGGIFAAAMPQQPLIADGGGNDSGPKTLLADGSHLFWAGTDGVYRAPRGGGTPEKLADIANARSLATDGNSLFVADGGSTVYAVTAPRAWHAIYTGGARDVATDGAHVYVVGNSGVVRMNADGGDQTNLSAGVTGQFEQPSQLTVDDTRVYFRIFEEGKIISVCK